MSTSTTPISFSSAVRVVSADAMDPNTKLLTETLFASTALTVFVSAEASATTTWDSTLTFRACKPDGFRTAVRPSTS